MSLTGQPWEGEKPTSALNKYETMDTINLEITSKEDVESNFSNASSEQVTVTTTNVSATLPKVEHVHSIEPTTLLWLLLVWFIVRMAQPFITHKKRVENGNGHSENSRSGPVKKAPARRKRTT